MLKIVIIEDEKPAARRLQRMLVKEGVLVNTILYSVAESVAWFKQHSPPDLIFADIQLSDGTSFDIFEQVPVQSAIIFTTAYDQYAIRAFKLNSIDYLLKPIKQDELHSALEKFQKNLQLKVDFKQLANSIKSNKYLKRLRVQYGLHLKSIAVEDISFFNSQNKTTWLVTKTGEAFIYDLSLEALEKQLDPNDFFRVNRQYIVSTKSVKDIIIYTNSRLKIILNSKDNSEIVVARERVKDFKNWLGN